MSKVNGWYWRSLLLFTSGAIWLKIWRTRRMGSGARVTFGLPGEQQDFATRHAQFLEILPTLTRRIDEVLALREFTPDPKREGESEGEWQNRVVAQRLVFFLGRLAAEDFMEILLLCANGYGMAGLRLLRSMFEGVVTGLYVAKHPDQASAFMGYHTVHQRRFLKAAEAARIDLSGIFPLEEQARIEEQYLGLRDSYRQMKCPECEAVLADISWTKMDPIAMAHELGLQELAVQCYSYTTLHIHTTPTRLLSRLEDTAEALRFKNGPQRAEADAAMVGAHCCLAQVLNAQNVYFDLGINEFEAELAAGIERAWGPDPGWTRVP